MSGDDVAVLVVDDAYAEKAFFEAAFGAAVESCRSVGQLERRVDEGGRWDVAFVDFSLGEGPTGLTALHRLGQGACSHLVTYTSAAESGRLLYLAAARHWFGARANLDKRFAEPDLLHSFVQAVLRGEDPTTRQLSRNLRAASLVDDVLRDPMDVQLWRAWWRLDGVSAAVEATVGVSPAVNRAFSDRAVRAAVAFDAAFARRAEPDIEGGYANKKGIITRFVSENYQFFAAPDLDRALSWRPRR